MVLYKHVIDDINKLTYVTRTEFKNGRLYMFYNDDAGSENCKMLPYRANKTQVLTALKFIRDNSDYYIKEAERYASGQYDIKNKEMVVSSSVDK